MTIIGLSLMLYLELGAMSGGVIQYEPTPIMSDVPPLYAEFGIRGEAGWFFAEGKISTDFRARSITSYTPTQETYAIGFGVEIGPLTVGYEHSCFHPVTPYLTSMRERYQVTPYFDGAYNRTYVRFTAGGKHD